MRLPVALIAAMLLVAGCGGEDRLSTEDYRAELKKICEESDRQTEQVAEPTRATPEAIADYLRRLRDVNASTIDKVEGLEPPEDLEDAHNDALDANKAGREKVDAVIKELEEGGDPTQVLNDARKELEEASSKAREAAGKVGVPECGD